MKYIHQITAIIRDFIAKRPQSAFQTGMVAVTGLFLMVVQALVPAVQAQTSSFDIKLDLNSEFPLVSEDSQSEIKLTMSEYEKRQIASQSAQRSVIPRTAPARIEGVSFEQKRALVKQTADKYAIDWKILEAVWQVESGKSWDTSRRSYAGATGPLQFMPSTFRTYAQDGNGDGQASIYQVEDALASAANLLAQSGLAEGDVNQALYNYNHSLAYVNKVKRVADSI